MKLCSKGCSKTSKNAAMIKVYLWAVRFHNDLLLNYKVLVRNGLAIIAEEKSA